MNAFFDSSRHPGIPGIALIPGKISGIAGNHEKFPDFFPGIPGMGTPLSPPLTGVVTSEALSWDV